MSPRIIQSEIVQFLADENPGVLCLTGRWGVGKSYLWSKSLNQAKEDGIGIGRYAYVSLFGLNSLEDLRYAIFENTVPLDQIEEGPDLRSIEKTLHFGEKWGRRSFHLFSLAPLSRAILSGAGRSLFLTVRNQIVCIDDIERHGKGLELKDVLGMASFLKEKRGCKVVIIFNDEKLGASEEEFKSQIEKVVDARIAFAPSPVEAAEIGVSSSVVCRDIIISNCVRLRITNIRVIKKIEISCVKLYEILNVFNPDVFKKAARTAALFNWCHYQPDLAPSLDFVINYSIALRYAKGIDKEEANNEEKAWQNILANYEFSKVDEFDMSILRGIQTGFFDSREIENLGSDLNKEIEININDKSLQAAWQLYRGSFKENADEIMDEMRLAFKRAVETISVSNFDSTISLFKDLGRQSQASELILYYFEMRSSRKDLIAIMDASRRGELIDAEITSVAKEKLASTVSRRDPSEILKRISESRGWDSEDLTTLDSLSIIDYQKLFEAHSGDETRDMILAALSFESIANGDPQMKSIGARAADALRSIGRRSPINARRMRLFGISLNDSED